MLRLASETEVRWAEASVDDLPYLLVEQAHLEKKAAAAAIAFMFRYPDHLVLQEPLSELAREELEHFELVLAAMRARGIEFVRQRPSTYAQRLLEIVRPTEPEKLLDQMLCNAAVEARSCERMMLLSRALRGIDDELADLYHGLVGSEARHHELYVDLAKRIVDPAEVEQRLQSVMQHEAEVVATAPSSPGLHNQR
ncbi:MAG: tRNA-(ms[2]io[6]A)-hydroxylase [Planctomycetes bacterium]|nr:tRNA-(ms[2]io[6]A)-hydroxylase [Planctomycetota bacterium]